jgi:xylulose-5-phosphate/fructose-6-phosphate phosphoketolase
VGVDVADPPAHLPAPQPSQPPRARLQGGGHDDDDDDALRMVMLNDLDRFHLVMDVIDRVPSLSESWGRLRRELSDRRIRTRAYTREHGEDDTEIRNWVCPF